MADRVYAPGRPVDGHLIIEGDEAHHLARVRRVAVGASVVAFDGQGLAWPTVVAELGRNTVRLRLDGPAESGPSPPSHVTLATALPKGDRVDWLVEKAAELGVARLCPLKTARSVVDPRATKLDRLRRRVVEAAKQSGRNDLMVIDDPMTWSELIEGTTSPVRLLAHPGGTRPMDWPRAGGQRAATLAIGPEGGFTQTELAEAQAAGWIVAGLGETVLRIETAGLAVTALVLALAERGDQAQRPPERSS